MGRTDYRLGDGTGVVFLHGLGSRSTALTLTGAETSGESNDQNLWMAFGGVT